MSEDEIKCPECGVSVELVDTTYSNVNTARSQIGQHTGDIYCCSVCGNHLIDNLLSGNLEPWSY